MNPDTAMQGVGKRRRRLEAENPDARISRVPGADGTMWEGMLGGVLSWHARSLGGLLDLMAPAAALRRPVLLAALRSRWQHTYRIWRDEQAGGYRAGRDGRLLAAVSAPGIERAIAADAAAHAPAAETEAALRLLRTRHGGTHEDIRFCGGRWLARPRSGTGGLDTDTAEALGYLMGPGVPE